MKRFISVGAAVACAAAVTAGSVSAHPVSSHAKITPGVITDIGGLGDRGFNDLAKAGLDQADKSLHLKGKILVPQTPADYANDLTQFAQAGAAPIFGIGFTFADAITQAATQFPKSHFAIVDMVVDKPNVASLVFKEEEGSYLAGVVAGAMTQQKSPYTKATDKVVGFIGGQKSPLIEKFGAGYEQGVYSVCPTCKVLYQYVGTTTTAFSDPGTAAEIARNMHAQGADVIYHAAGASGDGLFKVATDQHFFAIGVNTDQAKINPKAPILTSMLKRVDTAVASTIAAEAHGKFKAGVQTFGLSNGGIALASFGRFSKYVPAKLKKELAADQKRIIAGKLKVATTLAQVRR